MAAIVVLLVGALIEGCMSEQAAGTPPPTSAIVTDLPAPRLNQPMAVSPAPNPASPSNLAPAHKPVVAIASENSAAASHSTTVYVIKPGDTLTRIAKTHGTTVKALKTVNSLVNDHIVVGARLKIPEA